ncbi:hypothetical protein IEO21_02742 [Rhodonia placenta]|uniref:C2H2-type domain-containing protein n=1 Tax=Rhodonia placenta TaxID=104341 RepID=A0A8H7P718_9APHY|nr:hypothetical protein IEO21_02742 [Postia placenta]
MNAYSQTTAGRSPACILDALFDNSLATPHEAHYPNLDGVPQHRAVATPLDFASPLSEPLPSSNTGSHPWSPPRGSSSTGRLPQTSTRQQSPVPAYPPSAFSLSPVMESFAHMSLSSPKPAPSRVGSSRTSPGYSSAQDSDEDNGDGSDGEYTPRTPTRPRRYSPYDTGASPPTSPRRASRGNTSPVQSASGSTSSGRSRPRNQQTDVSSEQRKRGIDRRVCPVCDFKPASGRKPDLMRHIETHQSEDSHEKWVCCGVPVAKARSVTLAPGSKPYLHKGHKMIGGCLQGFSRKDALQRHLKNQSLPCAGTIEFAERMSEL